MPKKIAIPNLDDLLRRYQSGVSENQLAKEAGVNRWTFRRRLHEAGITPRSQSEAETIKWERMTARQRNQQVKAAHAAARGRKVSFAELCKRAKTREGNIKYNVSSNEITLGKWMRELGLDVIHNLAIGPYNCDIGTGSIVVEVWGGNWHQKPIDIKRTKYILDRGYSVLIVDIDERRYPLTRSVTEYIIALRYESSSNPAIKRQYWMIRGNGKLIFKRFNSDDITFIMPACASNNITNS